MGSIQLCVDSSQTLPPFTSALKMELLTASPST